MAKLTPALTKDVCEGIRLGLTHALAAQRAGISRKTFYRWLQLGRDEESGPHRDFLMAVEDAEANGAVRALVSVQKAASDGKWQAAAWLLERRFGYVRPDAAPVDSDGDDDAPDVDPFTPEGQMAIAKEIATIPEKQMRRIVELALALKGAEDEES